MFASLLLSVLASSALDKQVEVEENPDYFRLVEACSSKNFADVNITLNYQTNLGEKGLQTLLLDQQDCSAFMEDKLILADFISFGHKGDSESSEQIIKEHSPLQEDDKQSFKNDGGCIIIIIVINCTCTPP
eukprot:TRINITY_DN54132_c0_g1_i2.p1 TRINITY_DN54132_c0_g1~~TRINITY_DN54132_c0_g1_i2.p1  ORF type:complete len:131 (-),score=16.85 TRINITY_DN54132_c0_g1_i2:135-527(-)